MARQDEPKRIPEKRQTDLSLDELWQEAKAAQAQQREETPRPVTEAQRELNRSAAELFAQDLDLADGPEPASDFVPDQSSDRIRDFVHSLYRGDELVATRDKGDLREPKIQLGYGRDVPPERELTHEASSEDSVPTGVASSPERRELQAQERPSPRPKQQTAAGQGVTSAASALESAARGTVAAPGGEAKPESSETKLQAPQRRRSAAESAAASPLKLELRPPKLRPDLAPPTGEDMAAEFLAEQAESEEANREFEAMVDAFAHRLPEFNEDGTAADESCQKRIGSELLNHAEYTQIADKLPPLPEIEVAAEAVAGVRQVHIRPVGDTESARTRREDRAPTAHLMAQDSREVTERTPEKSVEKSPEKSPERAPEGMPERVDAGTPATTEARPTGPSDDTSTVPISSEFTDPSAHPLISATPEINHIRQPLPLEVEGSANLVAREIQEKRERAEREFQEALAPLKQESIDLTVNKLQSGALAPPFYVPRLPRQSSSFAEAIEFSRRLLPLPGEMQLRQEPIHRSWLLAQLNHCSTQERLSRFAFSLNHEDLALLFPTLATLKRGKHIERILSIILMRASHYLYLHGWLTLQYAYPRSTVEKGLSELCGVLDDAAFMSAELRQKERDYLAHLHLSDEQFIWTRVRKISEIAVPNQRHFISKITTYMRENDYLPEEFFKEFAIYTELPLGRAIMSAWNMELIEDKARGGSSFSPRQLLSQ